MIITVQWLRVTTIGAPGSCSGTLSLALSQPHAANPCITHPVSLGPLNDGARVPLGFKLDSDRCGDGAVILSVQLTVACRAGWLQRWWRQSDTLTRLIGQASQELSPAHAGQALEVPLLVPPGTGLIGQGDMPADPDIDSDMPDPRMALAAGEPNGTLALTFSR